VAKAYTLEDGTIEDFLGVLKSQSLRINNATLLGKERNIFFSLANEILSKLCSQVYLSSETFKTKFKEEIEHDPSLVTPNVSIDEIGIGKFYTLHGYPDARVRAFPGDIHAIQMTSDDSDSPTGTLGDSCIIEGKANEKCFNTNQLIAICVVPSFIEHNLHHNLSLMTPVIMLGASTVQICMYDCCKDILLINDVF